ncbi:MAG: hypothetical protein CR982_03140 [Candidatus Cloacimonadota bacterium]|nr:MAG: hypothetical protein CR982_03140 [Candidatus Cloacimonadota bacterium]PIE77429.1 MAG: hypothetical protein CSA15_13195 [Candidatus Delongbacteria bacterium]
MKKVPTKRCSHCNVEKPETDFPFKSKAKLQIGDVCRECKNKFKTQTLDRRYKAKENIKDILLKESPEEESA